MKILYHVYYINKNKKIIWKIKPFLSIFLFKKQQKNKSCKIFIDKKSARNYVIKKQLEQQKRLNGAA